MKKKNTLIKHILCFSVVTLLAGCSSTQVAPEKLTEKPKTNTEIQNLGNNQFKVGNILINKTERSFQVTGKLLRLEPPIEFLAVAKDGNRGYESLLELDVDVFQFNLACILIGLDKNKGAPPKHHFDMTPIQGDSAGIWLSWDNNGKSYHVEAANLFKFKTNKLESEEWVYTGSSFLPGEYGGYMPNLNGGTLIGLVHDPASIIEHRFGFGQGSFSDLKIDESLQLSKDQIITLHIKFNKKANKL